MATLDSYISRLPVMYSQRYSGRYWIDWANALLEKLSGRGFLPPLQLTTGVVPSYGVWIDKPIGYREAESLRNAHDESVTYRFIEENNRLKLLDVTLEEDPAIVEPTEILNVDNLGFDVSAGVRSLNYFKKFLFVVTGGTASGKSFVIGGSAETNSVSGVTSLRFLHPQDGVTSVSITDGYLISPDYYLILSYKAAFLPVVATSDDLGLSGYENLIDAWFRWKIEEQISAISNECMYWANKVTMEMNSLDAEMNGRMNTSKGRRLVGLEGRRRFR